MNEEILGYAIVTHMDGEVYLDTVDEGYVTQRAEDLEQMIALAGGIDPIILERGKVEIVKLVSVKVLG